ncbi:MAG: matrixin family metalloprotease, partial [Geminicoccaceae bacterium]
GWFVDASPWDNEEFAGHGNGGELLAAPSSPAFGRADLLTVVLHELGHVLGLGHTDGPGHDHDLMAETLNPTPTNETLQLPPTAA